MLELKKIKKIYKTEGFEQKALDDVNISFRRNEFVSILGQSGSGKTTLLNIIGGLDHYTSGDLIIDNKTTKQFKNKDWDTYRNHRIGFVFQSYNLIGHQSILSNVELALTLSGISKNERRKKAKEALKSVGLEKHLNKKPNQLSGGQMQRVAIARALVNDPSILLADEPTGALDSETSIQIMDILKEVSKDKLVIMVTHNPELAKKYSTRIINLKDGHIIGDTNPYNKSDSKNETLETEKENTTKKSMSLMTALSLSFNNLMTKRGRTILTAVAGSIGIVGIALIISLSNGVQQYINDMQKDVLSNEPISMEKTTLNYEDATVTKKSENKANKETDKISTTDDISNSLYFQNQSMTYENNLSKFKDYLEDNKDKINEYATNVQYVYNLDLQIYDKNKNDKISKISIDEASSATEDLESMDSLLKNPFSEMINSEEIINEQYDLVSGKLPSNYDELVLVVDENNQIPLTVMYSLGLKDKTELAEYIKKGLSGQELSIESEKYSFEDLIGKSYKLILSADYYIKENDIWVDQSSNINHLKNLYNDGTDLKIVGIIKAKENKQNAPKSGFVGYTHELIEYVINQSNDKEIAKQQFDNKDINVFTGDEFDNIESKYDENLKKIGAAELDNPSKINIYPIDYDSKNELKNIIKEYNDSVDKENQIKYSDLTETLLGGVKTAVQMVSYVLIAFVAISLIVSGIMISIITYISVLERTKEIGILRAIGASKKDVIRVFRAETIIEGLVSGTLGIIVATLLNLIISAIVNAVAHVENISSMPLIGAVVLVFISAALTLIAGSIPAKMASKKDPVESLRGE